MKTTFSSFQAISIPALALLVGCSGYSTNPTGAYNFPKVPPHNVKPEVQIAATSPFRFQVLDASAAMGPGQVHVVNFVEGKSRSFQIRVFAKSIVKSFTVTPQNLPEGAAFTRSKDDPSLFTLEWTPPFGLPDTNFKITLVAATTELSDPRIQRVLADDSMKLEVQIQRTDLKLEILSHTDMKEGVSEGEKHPFTVTVKDPIGGSEPITLQPVGDFRQSTERPRRNGSEYTLCNRAENLKDGVWTFFCEIDLQTANLALPLDKQGRVISSATGIDLCFYMVAHKLGFESSAPKPICVPARYATQTPMILWPQGEPTALKPKEASTLVFKLFTPNNMGSIAVENVSAGFSTWPGGPRLNCRAENPEGAAQICTLIWTPSCLPTRQSYTRELRVKATNVLPGKRARDTVFSKTLKVESTPEACPAPEARKATPKGDVK